MRVESNKGLQQTKCHFYHRKLRNDKLRLSHLCKFKGKVGREYIPVQVLFTWYERMRVAIFQGGKNRDPYRDRHSMNLRPTDRRRISEKKETRLGDFLFVGGLKPPTSTPVDDSKKRAVHCCRVRSRESAITIVVPLFESSSFFGVLALLRPDATHNAPC